MEDADLVRQSARESVDDIEPVQLREEILSVIDSTSIVPGVVTLLTAEYGPPTADDVQQRAVGVQLIYNGLELTRQLASTEPWTTGEREIADLNTLTAEVLVARGIHTLALSENASTAVDVIRSFGQDQMVAQTYDDPQNVMDLRLERTMIELALSVGTSTVSYGSDDELRQLAGDIISGCENGFPDPEVFFTESVRKRLSQMTVKTQADT